MKKNILYLTLVVILACFAACKKDAINMQQWSNSALQKNHLSDSSKNASVASTEYVYIAHTGTIWGSSLDNIDNWDSFRVYQDGGNRNLKVIWEATMKGKPASLPVMIGPGFCFLGPYPDYFFDYTLENEFMAIDRFGTGSGVVQHVYNIKIKKVIDRDTQEDITSQVSIFPAEGINVQVTKNIYNEDWTGGGNH